MFHINKIIIGCFILLLYSSKINAQTPNPLSTLALTAVLPPAPNAFEITRYSGLPVSLSAGSVSASIPLGEVKAGKVSVPVSLSYNSGNGIMINQAASRTGMSWVLNAGGVITRTVYDNPDESAQWLTPPANLRDGSQASYDYLHTATLTGSAFDTQTDIFNFNFNGYTGQFYLNPNNKTQAVMIASSNLKIETNFHSEFAGDWTFRITDPKGTKYYFGGTGSTETTKTNPHGVNSNCGRNFLLPIPNAWYLKSIQHYSGEYISLSYVPCSFDYFSDVSQTIIRDSGGPMVGCTSPSGCLSRNDVSVCLSDLSTTGVILKSISSRYETVVFKYSGRVDLPGDSLLTTVGFYRNSITDSTQHSLLNSYALNYINSSNNAYYTPYVSTSLTIRPFLTTVTRTATGQQPQTHSMSYYNINGLASRLSFAQDYWGYFNGINNQYLVPQNNKPNSNQTFPTNLANREPNGSYSYFGLLSKITYPTKGTDSLQYEPNTIYEARTILPLPTVVYRTQTGIGDHGEKDTTYAFNLYTDQNISFNISCVYSGHGRNDSLHQHLIVKVLNQSNAEIYNETFITGDSYTKKLLLGAGNYTLRLEAYGEAITGNVNFSYQQNGPTVYDNYQAGGVRVSKNISGPLTGNPLTKKYVYAALTSQAQSSGKLRAHSNPANYYSIMRDGTYCSGGDFGNEVGVCGYDIAYSTPLSQLTYFSGGHIYYSNVIELQDTLWANGGVEHQYLFANAGQDAVQVLGNAIPGSPITNFDFPTGLEQLRQTFFTTGNAGGSYQYTTVNKVTTHYVSDSRMLQLQDNYVVRKNWDPRTIYSPPQQTMFDPFDVTSYSLVSQWIYPDMVTTTNYDLAGANPVTTYQYDVYNSTSNLLLSERQTTGSDGIAQKITYSHPNEMVAAGATIPYQAMVNDNDIEPVIEQQYYKNSVFEQSIRTNYGDFGNHVYEPDSIQTKTTGGYDPRISFYGYTINGGLLSQAKYYGAPTSYLWGYNNLLPIAEAKNAEADELYTQNFEFLSGAGVDAINKHTGNQGYSAAYTVSFTPPVGSYVISWFQLNGSVWEYHREAYTGSKAFPGGYTIDDIAVYPADAQLSMFTYDPITGLTSGIDAKGETTYYEYDNYQRLVNVKDKDGNLVKHTDYHYQQ